MDDIIESIIQPMLVYGPIDRCGGCSIINIRRGKCCHCPWGRHMLNVIEVGDLAKAWATAILNGADGVAEWAAAVRHCNNASKNELSNLYNTVLAVIQKRAIEQKDVVSTHTQIAPVIQKDGLSMPLTHLSPPLFHAQPIATPDIQSNPKQLSVLPPSPHMTQSIPHPVAPIKAPAIQQLPQTILTAMARLPSDASYLSIERRTFYAKTLAEIPTCLDIPVWLEIQIKKEVSSMRSVTPQGMGVYFDQVTGQVPGWQREALESQRRAATAQYD